MEHLRAGTSGAGGILMQGEQPWKESWYFIKCKEMTITEGQYFKFLLNAKIYSFVLL